MFILLLWAVYYAQFMGLVKALVPSALQTVSVLSRATSNMTITCTFNGSNYSIISPSPGTVTCESIMRDVAAAMDISSNDRSVTDIVWSCLATVFACTWVSVHPNIPHPDASNWHIRRHRGLLMLCGLIAPELIVLWALRQWMGARYVARKMKEGGVPGFTMVHGHFMQMGGFILCDAQNGTRVISDHHELAHFSLPSPGAIQDKSKGDGLSKALVLGQTTWFVAQCISRWATGLAVTQVELVALAFAVLNGVVYFLWWDKPQDVRYAMQVERPPKSNLPQDVEVSMSAETHSMRSLSLFSKRRVAIIDDLQNIRRLLAESAIGKLLFGLKATRPPEDDVGTQKNLTISVLHSSFSSEDSFAATGIASLVGILFGTVHCAAWNFDFLTSKERFLWRFWSTIITSAPIVLCIRSVVTYTLFKHTYSKMNWQKMVNESWTKKFLLPIARHINLPSVWATALLVPIYVVARLGLLIQAGLALRDLLPGERAQVQWVNLPPHL